MKEQGLSANHSRRGNSSRKDSAKDFTESKSARSSLRTRTLPWSANMDLPPEDDDELHCARCASMSLFAASPRSMDLQASTTVAPFSAMRRAVSRPMPVFDPVMIVTCEGAYCQWGGRDDDDDSDDDDTLFCRASVPRGGIEEEQERGRGCRASRTRVVLSEAYHHHVNDPWSSAGILA